MLSFGEVADAQRDQVGALGDDARRGHGGVVVLQRDRVVGRVHDHEVGLRHRGHHPALRHLAHARADLALDLGVALELLVLLLQLLVAHLQPVGCRRRCSGTSMAAKTASAEDDEADAGDERAGHRADGRRQRQREDRGEGVEMRCPGRAAPMLPRTSASTLAFSALTTCCFENTRPMPVSGLSVRELGRQRLHRPGPAAGTRCRTGADQHHGDAERNDEDHQRRRPGEQLLADRVGAERLRAVEAQRSRQRVAAASRRPGRPPASAARRRRQRRRSGRGRASGRPGRRRAPCRACAARRAGSSAVRRFRPWREVLWGLFPAAPKT